MTDRLIGIIHDALDYKPLLLFTPLTGLQNKQQLSENHHKQFLFNEMRHLYEKSIRNILQCLSYSTLFHQSFNDLKYHNPNLTLTGCYKANNS
jgi:hypothetical protein